MCRLITPQESRRLRFPILEWRVAFGGCGGPALESRSGRDASSGEAFHHS
ncbi:MAG: hypothetical protein ACI9JZ_002809, partial [Lentimonas sp.]